MLNWWEGHGPPVYIAAAAYLGMIKPKKKKGSNEAGNLNELLKLAGPGGIIH